VSPGTLGTAPPACHRGDLQEERYSNGSCGRGFGRGAGQASFLGVWISNAGRYWATRRGNLRLTENVHLGWALTVDADSLAELDTRIKEQEDYEQGAV
jgi:hypothetical protein